MNTGTPIPRWYVDDQHEWRKSQSPLMEALCAKLCADVDAAFTGSRRAPFLLSIPAGEKLTHER